MQLDTHRIKKFPTEFLNSQRNGTLVRQVVRKYYTTSHSDLEALPETGKIILPLDHLPTEGVPPNMPPAIMIRFEDFINAKHRRRLELRWDALLRTDAKHTKGRCDKNRSAAEAFHFGIWEVTSPQPRVTTETKDQSPEAIVAIDALLRYVGDFVAPKIANVFEQHAPEQW